MANIRKRGNTYQIRVSCGYNTKGEQVVQTMSWRPPAGMTEKQAEKEVQKQAILFEERCLKGQVTANVKFEEFAEEWLESYAKLNLRNTSYERMKQLRTRVYPAIGHLRMDKITARHIQQFITDLALNGKSLGHSVISTTTSIYCHVFQQAQARAGEAIANVLDFKKKHDDEPTDPPKITVSSAS